MSEPSVRDAVEADLADVFALARSLAVFEHLEEHFVAAVEQFRAAIFGDQPVARVLIAEIDGAVAGIALWFPTFSTFLGQPGIWLEDLFVDERFRRLGVAAALLGELRRRTPGRLEWEVLDWNEGAIALYDQLGAKPFTGWVKYRLSPDD